MEVGIIGPKQSGKSTVFFALTGGADSGKGGKANLGVIKVPDPRIDDLAGVFSPQKTTFAEIRFVDLQGDNEKESKGLDPQIVAQIRKVDALVAVVRAFDNPSVPHPAQSIDPVRDYTDLESELRLNDFVQVESRLERMKKENKKGIEMDVLVRCKNHLEADAPLRTLDLSANDVKSLSSYQFLSQKPVLVLMNTSEGEKGKMESLQKAVVVNGACAMELSAKVEYEIAQLPPEEQKGFLAEMGIDRPARERFIRETYAMMNLISMFTAGEDEVRAWTIRKGTKAQPAAGKIHSDLEKGFIRANVVHYDDFMKSKSFAKAKETGVLRQEGKEYEVKDGDIVEIKFNV